MLGALIGAAASLGGMALQNKANKKANAAAMEEARRQENVQREFAQSGIQWKVQDAKKAGIHPLYALGANTQSYSPITVGQSGPDYSGLADAGQNIGRAVEQTMDPTSRTIARLGIERAGLENELLKSQIAQTRMQTTGIPSQIPGGHIPGQQAVMDADMFKMGGQPDSGIPPMHEGKNPQFTRKMSIAGANWRPHPGFTDAQTMEDRYGEIVDYVYGPGVVVADYLHNYKRHNRFRKTYDKYRYPNMKGWR